MANQHFSRRRLIRHLLLSAVLLISCQWFPLQVYAQVDTLFWFAVPDFSDGHGAEPLYLRFTTLSELATVEVDQPANPAFAPIIFTIPANTSYTLDMTPFKDEVENIQPDVILDRGLRIRSTAYLNAYYENASFLNPEIFTLKGQNALGKEFVIPMQDVFPNGNYNPTPYASFEIVATEDNTRVTITPSHNIVGHNGGSTFTIVLNKGQTYVARARVTTAGRHLDGSLIIADKPIAVTIKDDSMASSSIYGGCADLGGDQITPIDLLGTRYITVPGNLRGPNDGVFVEGVYDNTEVSVNGNLLGTIDRGELVREFSNGAPMIIETSKPAYVLHMSGFGCEVGLDQMPLLDPCNGSKLLSINRSSDQSLFINILVYRGLTDDFTFNGRTDIIEDTDFQLVAGTNGDWYWAKIEIPLSVLGVGQAALIENKEGPFQLSVIHGGPGSGTMYGYFSDYGKLEVLPELETSCAGGTQLSLDTSYQTYSWSTGDTSSILFVDTTGYYSVTVTNEFGCVAVDTIFIDVLPEARNDIRMLLCPDENLVIEGEIFDVNNVSGEIILPGASSAGCDSIIDVKLEFFEEPREELFFTLCDGDSVVVAGERFDKSRPEGIVRLPGASANGCDSILDVRLTYYPLPQLYVSTYLCQGDTAWFGGKAYTENVKSDTIQLSGASSAGCDSFIYVTVVKNPINMSVVELGICEGDTAYFQNTAFHLGREKDTLLATELDLNGCDSFIDVRLKIYPEAWAIITDTLCPGETFSAGGVVFTKNNPSGFVTLEGRSQYGCDSTISVDLYFPENELTLPSIYEVAYGEKVQLQPTYQNIFDQWMWSPPDLLSCDDCESPWYEGYRGQQYLLRAIDPYGCPYEAVTQVIVKNEKKVFIPNAFTPNGDGVNDGFTAFVNYFVEEIEFIEIYDRWGNFIIRIENIPPNLDYWGWDGTHAGEDVNPGVFAYRIGVRYLDQTRETFYGDVTVLR